MSRARSVPRPVRDKPPSGERHPFVSHELTVMHESAHVRGRCRDEMVAAAAVASPGILSGTRYNNPLSLENNVLYNRESNPTGFGKAFVWWVGLHQLNYFPVKRAVAYARY